MLYFNILTASLMVVFSINDAVLFLKQLLKWNKKAKKLFVMPTKPLLK